MAPEAYAFLSTDGYHIYRDPTTFAYDITLARANLTTNKNQRYTLKVTAEPSIPLISTIIFPSFTPTRRPRVFIRHARAQRLQLYESNSIPKLYTCYTKYSAHDQSSAPEVLAPLGSSFELAFDVFKQFFRLKTHREWDDRLIKVKTVEEEAFVYTPPRGGVPKGMILPAEEETGFVKVGK